MSFKCDKCFKSPVAGSKPFRVVMKQRGVSYTEERNDEQVEIGFGTEIVSEENWCTMCYEISSQENTNV